MQQLLYFLLGAVVAAAVTFYFTRRFFIKQVEENPPINEKMIRAMFMQMGRKPSEAQIRQVMSSMGVKTEKEREKAKQKRK